MILDFERIPESVMENFKGGEKCLSARMFTDERNRIFKGRLAEGASIGMHRHENDCEMIYVLSGKGKIVSDEGTERIEAGQCHYCPKGCAHSLVNDSAEDLVFFAVVAGQ